jgi:hypothetical protein
VVAQKIIYDTIAANDKYRGYGFRDSEGDQCTTNIINKYYGITIDRWACLSLVAEKMNEKWVSNVTTQSTQKETKPMGLSQESYQRLAEDDQFMELILKLIPEAIRHKLGDVDVEVIGELTAHLAPKMVLVDMED